MIKKTGAILFSFLLLHAQVYAIKGGPWDSVRNVYGTYSAILVPDNATNLEELNEDITTANEADDDPTNDDPLLLEDPSTNSLGLVVMVITPDGFGGGYSVLFAEGYSLTGPIVALADPDSGEINGVIQNSVNLVAVVGPNSDGEFVDVEYAGTGNGLFKAKLSSSGNRSLGTILQRIEGNAFLNINTILNGNGSGINFILDGYRSSNSTDVSSVVAPNFGNLDTN